MGEVMLGALLALLTQAGIARYQRAGVARSLALALWEELSAIEFGQDEKHNQIFAGFSSQVFDTRFADVSALPRDLERAVMRYHWKMKFLATTTVPPDLYIYEKDTWNRSVRAAREEWEKLRIRLDHFAHKSVLQLTINKRETIGNVTREQVDRGTVVPRRAEALPKSWDAASF